MLFALNNSFLVQFSFSVWLDNKGQSTRPHDHLCRQEALHRVASRACHPKLSTIPSPLAMVQTGKEKEYTD